jgi:hypothetical protein
MLMKLLISTNAAAEKQAFTSKLQIKNPNRTKLFQYKSSNPNIREEDFEDIEE